MNFVDLDYYRNNPIAFEFHTEDEFKQLIQLFGREERANVTIGRCAFWLDGPEYSHELGPTRVINEHSYYSKHNFQIILASEFLKDAEVYIAIGKIKQEIGI